VKVLLIQADGTFPNLALMKISSYHKQLKDQVFYSNLKFRTRSLYSNSNIKRLPSLSCDPDRIYISVIFSWNKWIVNSIKAMHSGKEIIAGGYMLDPFSKLPNEIEHICPDYQMYPIDYSIGFTSRGCNRKCEWCYVWKVEGSIKEWSPLEEFVRHKKVILLDNNFLQSPKSKEKLMQLIENNIKVCFNQGLDIRLVNDEIAHLLVSTKFYNHNFSSRQLFFAWDNPKEEKMVLKGIEKLLASGLRPSQLAFYILSGFNTTLEEDLYRINKLLEIGCDPYLMLYNKYEKRYSRELLRLERYINRRIYKRYNISLEKYLELKMPKDSKLSYLHKLGMI